MEINLISIQRLTKLQLTYAETSTIPIMQGIRKFKVRWKYSLLWTLSVG